ncbi:MAG: NifU family protein [Bacilli bacterium]|nr:NifU family protein [Bacilli bacterium]MCQ2793825.1 NifU family protein [Bacilli bacterium]
MANEEVIKAIKATLEKVRPFLQRDGGDVEFDSFIDGTVYIKMIGACEGCAFIDNTIKDGIEIILLEEVKEVKAVKPVSEKPQ